MALAKVEIDDETARFLWARCLGYLHSFVVAECGFEHAPERVCYLIRRMLPDLGHYAFEAISCTAPGAFESILRFRISRTLERDIAMRAFDDFDGHSGLRH